MSVIVKDMEMPKNCYTCNLCNYYNEPNQGCYCVALRADLHSTDIMKEREKNCPLIELPPHGDLISREWLVVIGQHLMNIAKNDDIANGVKWLWQYAIEAPTIIEAEGE